MRTHSGLHVLCGVVFRDFGALVTGGNMEPSMLELYPHERSVTTKGYSNHARTLSSQQ
jgi:hypothetical protein